MLNQLIESARSTRSFKPDVIVSQKTLEELVDTARKAPAAMNLQPLKYKLVTSAEEKNAIMGITRWATSLSVKLPPDGHEPSAFIVICHDKDIAEERPIFMIDVGIVAEVMILAAKERGLDCCLIGSATGDAIKNALSLPENIAPKLILALGVSDETAVLENAKNGNVTYYRDKANTHHVPKRRLEDIIIK